MSELAYLFDLALFQDVKEEQARFCDRMISTWVDFARTGRTDWPGFRGADGHVQTAGLGRLAARGLREGSQLPVLEEPPLTGRGPGRRNLKFCP